MKSRRRHLVSAPRHEQHGLRSERGRVPPQVEARLVRAHLGDERGAARPADRPAPAVERAGHAGLALGRAHRLGPEPEVRAGQRGDAVHRRQLARRHQRREAAHAVADEREPRRVDAVLGREGRLRERGGHGARRPRARVRSRSRPRCPTRRDSGRTPRSSPRAGWLARGRGCARCPGSRAARSRWDAGPRPAPRRSARTCVRRRSRTPPRRRAQDARRRAADPARSDRSWRSRAQRRGGRATRVRSPPEHR